MCSSFAVHWKDTSFPLVAKRIHPYLHTHTRADAWTNEEYTKDWQSGCESYDYVKSFLLDFSIPHDLPYHGLLQNYAIQSDRLSLSCEDVNVLVSPEE